jgi:hypothetical protein
MGGVSVTPLAASVATLLAIAWVVSFQHDHSSLYDTAAHPEPQANFSHKFNVILAAAKREPGSPQRKSTPRRSRTGRLRGSPGR